jgi:hypothetical protein
MNRRTLLAAGAATIAAPRLGLAQAPSSAAAQAPTHHRMNVGGMEVFIITDGQVNRPDVTQGAVANASADQVRAALAAGGVQGTALPNPFNITVVRASAGLVALGRGRGRARRRAGRHRHRQHARARPRSGAGEGRGAHPFPRRPHRRPDRRRRRARLPERADHGAGAGMGLLDRCRRGEPRQRCPPPRLRQCPQPLRALWAKVERFQPGATIAPGITSFATKRPTRPATTPSSSPTATAR